MSTEFKEGSIQLVPPDDQDNVNRCSQPRRFQKKEADALS
jgi:hypothetical protein